SSPARNNELKLLLGITSQQPCSVERASNLARWNEPINHLARINHLAAPSHVLL
ncbi:hypothetical protein A2U01_0099441, partial [Trifolium medium]|nr:hypothetical protein [Trifolium medium]